MRAVLFALLVCVVACQQGGDTFTDYPHCKNRCSSHGICVNNVCHCARGWTGEDCSTVTCPYPCLNGGTCTTDVCTCPIGFIGVDCGLAACPQDCSGHGVCVNGTCNCISGFAGLACEQSSLSCPNNCSSTVGQGECVNGACYCKSSWAGDDCSKHVCSLPCSSHGVCTIEHGMAKCRCDDGYAGDDCARKTCPPQCDEHGTCDDDGNCVCHLHWHGLLCDTPICHPPCGEHGVCRGNYTVECQCDDGWTGLDCSVRQCPHQCSYRGTCNPTTGTCECPPEYTGADCSYTTIGNKHMRGCQTRAHCSDHGLCVNSHCKCMKGWYGDMCQHAFDNRELMCPNGCSGRGLCNYQAHCVCVFPYSGADCADAECTEECLPSQRCVSGKCVCSNSSFAGPQCDKLRCPNACSHHGKCHTNTGTCECYPGFDGPECAVQRCPLDCSNHGICNSNFTCFCDAGWTGIDCSKRSCESDCSGHGSCDGLTGQCACSPGWWGLDCSTKQCSDMTCSMHGVCVNGSCVCDFGWEGSACENRTCPRGCNAPRGGVCTENFTCQCRHGYFGVDCYLMQPLETSCPRQCSDHGHCVSQACVCQLGWTGEACDVPLCADRCFESSQRGVCNASRVCECADGYSGRYCERVNCKDGCNEPNGHCDFVTGRCRCSPGFAGANCSQPENSQLLNCSGHGTVGHDGRCVCESAWAGFRCEQKRCPDDCSGHGLCANGTCICEPGFEGKNCGYGSVRSNYKHNCDRRCASSCIPRCKHVHGSAVVYPYSYLNKYTGLLDQPNRLFDVE